MKKLLILLFSLLISFNSNATELDSLFGISLYGNAEKYVSSKHINTNKTKNRETIDGYFDLNITDNIKEKNPYFLDYWIIIDSNNIVHKIIGFNELTNLDICQAVKESLSSALEKKYQIEFLNWEDSYPLFKIYTNYHFTNQKDYLAIQCNKVYENTTAILQMYLNSSLFGDELENFYDSGL
jgi:hypothetical protein